MQSLVCEPKAVGSSVHTVRTDGEQSQSQVKLAKLPRLLAR